MTPPPSSFIRASSIYFALAMVVLAVATGYGVFKYTAMENYQRAIAASDAIRAEIEASAEANKKEFKELSDQHRVKDEEFREKIVSILPPDEYYTDLTRILDEYFFAHDTPGNPIFQSSLRYGKSSPLQGFPGISVLPITMNIDSSRDNFFKFIDFISNSGSLDTGLRLMALSSIQINFPDEGEILESPRQNINFTVDMNAYHETSKVKR